MALTNSKPSVASSTDAELAELLERMASQMKAGSPPSLEDFVSRWPEHESEIRDLYPTIAAMIRMGTESPLGEENVQDALVEAGSIMAKPSRRRLGDFQILREVGRGGMGVVYEAEQVSLGRRVALKVLPFAAMLDERLLKRFKNEARAAATLDHPHIVSVHFIGCERGIHFFAMQYVDGQTLEEVVNRLKNESASQQSILPTTPQAGSDIATCDPSMGDDTVKEDLAAGNESSASWLPGDAWESSRRIEKSDPRLQGKVSSEDPTASLGAGRTLYHRLAQLACQAADAVEHAHQQRIIHRDLKPSNLMLDEHGHIWVTDFGLATTHGENNLTMSGDLIGTLRYSSPEQARGGVVDHRTDIYSLGITLYELLALRAAFVTDDRQSLLDQILNKEPPRLRKLRPDIPIDLEVIVQKAIAKDPQERYQSARELADDLRRFLSHQPIKARPPQLWELAIKWVRRRPGVTLVLAAASLAAIAVTIALSIYTAQLRWAFAQVEELNKVDLRRQSVIHRGIVYPASISSAAAYIEQRNFAAARQALDACNPPKPEIQDPCGFEWSFLENRLRTPQLQWTFAGSGAPIMSVAISPDDGLAATGDSSGIVSLWDMRTGQRVKSWRPFKGECRVAFSPRGSWLAAASDYLDKRVIVWGLKDLKQVALFEAHDGTTYGLEFSPDEKWLATAGRDGAIKLWNLVDLTNGQMQPPLQWQAAAMDVVYDLKISPDGSWVMSSEKQERLRTWNMKDGSLLSTITQSDTTNSFQSCELLEGGRLCAAGGYADRLRFFDVAAKREVASFDLDDSIFAVAASADQRLVAAGCDDGSVTVWRSNGSDLRKLQRICFGAHSQRVRELAFSHDNRWLLSAGADGTAKVWKLETLPSPDVTLLNLRLAGGLHQVGYDPQGKWLAALGHDGKIRILSAADNNLVTELSRPEKLLLGEFTFDSAGGRLAAISKNEVFVWNTEEWSLAATFKVPGGVVYCRFGRDENTLITLSSSDGTTCELRAWDVSKQSVIRTLNLGAGLPVCTASSPGSGQLAVGMDGEQLTLVDLESWRQKRLLLPVNRSSHLSYSRDGKRIIAVGNGNRFCVVNANDGSVTGSHRIVPSEISAATFTADNRLVALADRLQKCIHFWDAETSRVLFTVDTLDFAPEGLELSPDGWTLTTSTAQADAQGVSGLISWDLMPDQPAAIASPAEGRP